MSSKDDTHHANAAIQVKKMTLEEELRSETEKWLQKAVAERAKIKAKNDYTKNIDAYISDSFHFMKKNDLVRAFEAVIWAWSWIEIGREQKII